MLLLEYLESEPTVSILPFMGNLPVLLSANEPIYSCESCYFYFTAL